MRNCISEVSRRVSLEYSSSHVGLLQTGNCDYFYRGVRFKQQPIETSLNSTKDWIRLEPKTIVDPAAGGGNNKRRVSDWRHGPSSAYPLHNFSEYLRDTLTYVRKVLVILDLGRLDELLADTPTVSMKPSDPCVAVQCVESSLSECCHRFLLDHATSANRSTQFSTPTTWIPVPWKK